MLKSTFSANATKIICSAGISLLALIASAKPVEQHGYNTGHFALELDGQIAGWVTGVEGGSIKADVITEKLGADNLLNKQSGAIKYQEISLRCGLGMSKQLYDWIKAECAGTFTRHTGAIVTTDASFRPIQRMEFYNGVLSEIGFPALDAASKDAAYLTIHISPQMTKIEDVKGQSALKAPATVQKRWLPANFKLSIKGLDCTKVNKIEAIVIKQKVVESATGALQDYQKAGSIQDSNVIVTLPETNAQQFETWRQLFVVKGNTAAAEKTGSLVFLDAGLQNSLFTLNFMDLGIFKISVVKTEPGSDNIKRVKVEMYCERITFDYRSEAFASRRAKPSTGG